MAPNTEANGTAPNLDLSGNSLSPEQLAYVFGHVPWVEFNVTAKANLNAFTGNPAVRHVVQQVAQATVKDITGKLVKDLTNKFEQALQQAIADSTNAVASHITDNMNQLFKGLQSDTKARPFTAFQRLQDGDGDVPNSDVINKDFNAPGWFNSGNQNINGAPGATPGGPSASDPSGGTSGGPSAPTPADGAPGPAGTAARTPFGTNSGNVIGGDVSGTNSNSFNPNSNNNNNNADPGTPNTPAGAPGGPTTPGGTVINASNSGNIIGGSVSGTNTDSFNPNSNNNNNNGPKSNTDTNPPPKAAITVPDIATGTWIWTPELPYDNPPQAPRGFRKTMNIPSGKVVDSLIIDITCDNFQTVYINGACLGYGLDFRFAKRWSVTFPPTNKVVIAVYAANDPISKNVAGLLAAAVAWNSTRFQGETFKTQTDASWKCTTTPPPRGFETTNFNDRTWGAVRTIGPYGMAPWIPVFKPTKTEAITEGFKTALVNGIPDAPKAPLATPGPDVDGSTDL